MTYMYMYYHKKGEQHSRVHRILFIYHTTDNKQHYASCHPLMLHFVSIYYFLKIDNLSEQFS